MIRFDYRRASSSDDAMTLIAQPGYRLLGGGTNLVDLMRKGIEHPLGLVDVTALSDTIEETATGGLMIGAATRNSALAAHDLVRERYPLLSRAVLAGASGQIRNMATMAGNLMQRTRCAYFNDQAGSRCNKRQPGSGCDAAQGFNRYNAILGASNMCSATHPSDMCVALAALDARVHLLGPVGERVVAMVDFHRLPGDRPDLETVLEAGEIITAIELPVAPVFTRSIYRKVRDRASYAFALVSVGVAVRMEGETIGDLRLAFGGIAPKPWRAFRAEEILQGSRATQAAIDAAVEAELAAAVPLAGNAFKVELLKRTARAVITEAAGGQS